MAVYVVRHAKAGDRLEWSGDDRLRPLTKSGKQQAEALAKRFEGIPIDRILSSGYVRCMETLDPLARRRKLPVEAGKELEEGAGAEGVLRIVEKSRGRHLVLCTHGDVVEELLERLIAQGLVQRARANMEKASTWVLDEKDGKITGARYLAAP
ncbi:MAG TPA: phosphoglycerate mutase family protein [Candidatus Dormibacteraeota bacterium]|nr:phosphoglycerate mutase family protein [Candidatus Dormibacteraeota bacterium]